MYQSKKSKRFAALSKQRWSKQKEQTGIGDGGETEVSQSEEENLVGAPELESERGESSRGIGPTPMKCFEPGQQVISSTEESSDATSDSDHETPVKKQSLDPEFQLTTPERRGLAEFPILSNGMYLGQTSQLQAFIEQINATSKCATPSCEGHLKPVIVTLAGLGGAISVQYSCSGCTQCQLTFSSSIQHEASKQTAIGLALQVVFIAAGCSYAQYQKVLANTFGVYAVSSKQFLRTIERMHPHVKTMIDNQCELAKQRLKSKPADELGSFQNVVTTADGAWLTRGFHSQNFTYQVRDYLNGALLYYLHLSQRGSDKLCDGDLYEGTSKSSEGHATSVVFSRAKEEGMNVTIHWMDKDSSSALAIKQVYPDAKLMLCGGHAARAHQKALKNIQTKKSFTIDEQESIKKKYPNVDVTLKCHCSKRHKIGCGCMTDQFIVVARNKFFRALIDAGTEPEKFVTRMKQLPHHARDEHQWEDGQCDFHQLTLCTCERCDENDVKCEGKVYKTINVLTCPYHSLAYEIECMKRSQQASEVIHPVLGRGHTNQIEASHNVLLCFRSKNWHLTRLHYQVSTNLGLLQSNMTFMNHVHGLGYHWLSELLQRMELPVLQGVEAVLKQSNTKRHKKLQHSKTVAVKKARIQWKSQHRGKEQEARKKWGQSQKVQHTYGDKESESIVSTPTKSTRKRARSHKQCKCGSTTHSRTTHRDCPKNKRNVVGVVGSKVLVVPVDKKEELRGTGKHTHDHEMSDEESIIYSEDEWDVESERFFSSSDEEDSSIQLCMCEGRAHSRSCPFNPRNRGAPISTSL